MLCLSFLSWSCVNGWRQEEKSKNGMEMVMDVFTLLAELLFPVWKDSNLHSSYSWIPTVKLQWFLPSRLQQRTEGFHRSRPEEYWKCIRCSSLPRCLHFHLKAGSEAEQVPSWHACSMHTPSSRDEGLQPGCNISSLSTDTAVDDQAMRTLPGASWLLITARFP